MTTSYRGMYRRGSADNPTDVQVVDPGGNSTPLPIDLYESRGVLPEWNDLPTEKQYKVLLAVHDAAQGSFPFINTADAEACVVRGWLEPVATNSWMLTVSGKRFL